jgi:PIN domain nuclease of toxin-antitoxin system
VKLLFDTHALIWWATNDSELSLKARRALGARAATLFVSAVSAYEMSYKFGVGKATRIQTLIRDLETIMQREGFQPLPITLEHGRRAGELYDTHGDPFDRLLAAQSIVEDMPIVSNDTKLSALGAKRVW